jgi:hypothetical protein
MNKSFKMIILLMSASAFLAGPAVAGGHTAEQMERAGYDCFEAGPNDWIHCMDLDKLENANPVVPVNVFSVDGSEFLGTELLLHEDTYAAQPCPQDDLNLWGDTGFGYFACHHFSTGHH